MKKQIPFGKYLLLERVNVGGMAEVYKAKTVGVEGFEKLLAIKRILPNIAEDDEFIAMFIDEAKISVQLTHSNIAQIYDLGKIGDSYFIAMEYISGKDMRGLFDRMRKRGEPLPIPMTCYLLGKVCEGLDYAHRKKDAAGRDLNIVHRDVSPQNVLVSFDGEVKLIDFGIAKAANKASRTQAGILKGKFGYMSPEQVRGLPIDRRSDVFAVGVCLFEQLTGERLFYGESDFSTLEKVRNVDVVPPSTYNPRIPEALDAIVMKALAKDVEDRYQWCSDLGDDLQRFLITSDTIFGRTDLANFMKATFAEDLEREKVKNQQVLSGTAGPTPFEDDPFSDDLPGAMEQDDSTQLFDPSAAFDEQSASPSAGPEDGVSSAGEGPPLLDPVPSVGSSPAAGRARPSGPPSPPRLAPSGPPPVQPPRPLSGRLDVAPGSLADLEDDDDEEIPTIAEGRLGAAVSRAPTAPPRVSKKKGGRGKAVLYSGLGLLAMIGIGVGGYHLVDRVGMFDRGEPTGILVVRGPQGDAQVFLDGALVSDRLPTALRDVAVGAVTLRVKRDGYEPYEEQVVVLPGEHTEVTIELRESKLEPASLLVVSVPLDARVTLNDELVKEGGVTPWQSRDIAPGQRHVVLVEKDGYWPEKIEWTPEPGEEKSVTVTLEEAVAKLVVESNPSRARVFLDGRPRGRTPVTLRDLDGSKRYQLEIKRGGCFEDWSTTVLFDGEPERKISVDLERIPGCGTATQVKRPAPSRPPPQKVVAKQVEGTGTLSINTRPGWAWVIINGNETNRHTPLVNYELPAGDHTVLLRAPDGREQTVHVTIKPDEMTRRTVDFE